MLVARLDHMGDVLLSGPAVRAVAAGGHDVVLAVGRHGRDAAALLPCVHAVVELPAPWIDVAPDPMDRATFERVVDEVTSVAADAAIVLTSFHQSALPLAMALKVAGLGRVTAISEDYPGSLLDDRVAPPPGVHEVERALAVVAAAGHRLPSGDDGRLAVRLDHVPARRTGRVVVHPGASVPARTWSAEGFAAVVAGLATAGREVVVTGSEGEKDLVRSVAGAGAGVEVGGSLASLARLLASAGAVVVGNTGPAHLAAAVGTPVVAVFPPTVDPVAWRPWGVPHRLLGDLDIACRGCRARRCPRPGHPCVDGVTPDQVVAAVDVLAPAPPTPAPPTPVPYRGIHDAS